MLVLARVQTSKVFLLFLLFRVEKVYVKLRIDQEIKKVI